MEGVQALGELAIAAAHLRRSGSERALGIDNSQWHRHICSELASSRFAELPRKQAAGSFPFLLPYLVMRADGWRDDYFEETIRLLRARRLPECCEVVPFRALDVRYFFARSDRGFNGRDLLDLYERTCLARMVDDSFVDEPTAYAITHTLFYLSDFGLSALPLERVEVMRIRDVVESLLVHYWRLEHWDLVGELLICSLLVGAPRVSVAQDAARAFRGVQMPDGAIPGRSTFGRQPDDGTASRFSRCYHPTVVSLLHSSLSLALA
jgi:hypothetical protein